MNARAGLVVRCDACHRDCAFEQPYKYHAGFGDQGFLYDDAGTCTLVWGSYDPVYSAMVGPNHPWMLTDAQRALVEASLALAPSGGRWRFANPPRCVHCGSPIGGSILDDISYFFYPGSISVEQRGFAQAMASIAKPAV